MAEWNYGYLIIGLFGLITSFIVNNVNAKIYLDKLEYKYGKIDKEKVIKLNKFITSLLSSMLVIVGLIIRNLWFARIIVIISISLCILIYFLYRRKFIKSQKELKN